MFQKFLHVHVEAFVGLSIVGNVIAGLEKLEVFISIQASELKLSGVYFNIVEILKMLIDILSSLRNTVLLEVVIFLSLLHQCLNIVILIVGLKHEIIVVADFKHFRNSIKCFVPRNETSEEYLSIDCGDGYGVIEDYTVLSFFYFDDVLFWDLDEGIAEEDVAGVELGVEAQSMGCDVQPT